jgi:hypothetical protein
LSPGGSGGGHDQGHWAGPREWEGENVLVMHDRKGLGKCKVGIPHSHEGLGANGGHLVGGV